MGANPHMTLESMILNIIEVCESVSVLQISSFVSLV